MDPRAQNPTALTGPTGPSLLDQSKATPSDINPELFKSRNPSRQPTEGTVSSDYLKRTREEDPWPAESSCAPKTNAPPKSATVTLSDCRIDTPTEDLATDQPFQMSCQATTSDGSPLKGDIRFKLYCTLPDGTEKPINLSAIGQRKGDRYCAEGTLFSPKEPVEWGAPLKYYVTAEHPGAGEKAKSGVAEVVGYMPPKPVAVWTLEESYFQPSTSFILPHAVEEFETLRDILDTYPDSMLAIFGHSDCEDNSRLGLSLALEKVEVVYNLLIKNSKFWCEMFDGELPRWDLYCYDVLRQLLRPDAAEYYGGVEYSVLSEYMGRLFNGVIEKSKFVGSPSDNQLQWTLNLCPNANRRILKNSSNSRVTIAVFLNRRQRSRAYRFPCPQIGGIKMGGGNSCEQCWVSKVGGEGFYQEIDAIEKTPKEYPPSVEVEYYIPNVFFRAGSAVPDFESFVINDAIGVARVVSFKDMMLDIASDVFSSHIPVKLKLVSEKITKLVRDRYNVVVAAIVDDDQMFFNAVSGDVAEFESGRVALNNRRQHDDIDASVRSTHIYDQYRAIVEDISSAQQSDEAECVILKDSDLMYMRHKVISIFIS